MKYYSTNDPSRRDSLREAVLRGLAPDKGLYMPESIPVLSAEFIQSLDQLSLQKIAEKVLSPYLSEWISAENIRTTVRNSFTFECPVINFDNGISILELFHGPTLAFKDFGARFLGQLFSALGTNDKREVMVLVATSGDTGGAVAQGMHNIPGVRVVILYPSGRVSPLQEKQFTTLGGNITAIKIQGSFDDCQHLVKECFHDQELQQSLFLTSANSINIGRLLPQIVYYFSGYANLSKVNPAVIAVPSGNFGNLAAGLIAKRMGLPISKFVACTNINDVVPEYLRDNKFTPRPSSTTISNAMDVGNPSNFARILELYDHNWDRITSDVVGYSFSDEETKRAIQSVYKTYNYILDPHSAVAYLGLKSFMSEHSDVEGLFLGTAHPAKFKEIVAAAIPTKIDLPVSLKSIATKNADFIECSAEFSDVKNLLEQLK